MAITSKIRRSTKVYEPRVAPVDNKIVAPPLTANVDTDESTETKEAQVTSATGANHPLASLAGKYADEPLGDDFMAPIQDYRREQNELEDIAE